MKLVERASVPSPEAPVLPRRVRLLAVVLTGVYSWALTVLPPLSKVGFATPSGALAAAALLTLLVAPFVAPGRIALAFALDGFVGLCALSWVFGREQLIDPPLAVFGSFGWLAYTFALGSLSTPRDAGTTTAPGVRLQPRTRPSRLSALVLVTCLVTALVLMALAWKVHRPALAVLAHVFTLATILLVMRSGAHLATYLQVRTTKLKTSPRLGAAMWPLLLLALLLLMGGFWSAFAG